MLPEPHLVTVQAWPRDMLSAVEEIVSLQAMTVISVPTPSTTDRIFARSFIRTALRETLGVFLDKPASKISLVARPGERVRLEPAHSRLSLSISHSPGLSVAAIHRSTSVGIDLMRIETGIDKNPDWMRVASDYLGPQIATFLQTVTPSEFPIAFTQAWTRFEACLKCLGLALTEWSPGIAKQLENCRLFTLNLPNNYWGSVAIHEARPQNRAADGRLETAFEESR